VKPSIIPADSATSAAARRPEAATIQAPRLARALLLRALGHETFLAHSGREALEIAQREQPAAVILDIGMPGMTGYQVAERIRAQDWGRHALLLAVTGWGQEEDKARAAAAGFDHHFTKPVSPEAVEAILARLSRQIGAGRVTRGD